MNVWLISAALLSVLTALVHSLLGEVLIFRHLRAGITLVPSLSAAPLRERHVRILWASWHLISVMGIAMAYVLYALANLTEPDAHATAVLCAIVVAYALCSAMVLIATRGRHPGWVALLAVSGLVVTGLAA